jgi:hypothetical protein
MPSPSVASVVFCLLVLQWGLAAAHWHLEAWAASGSLSHQGSELAFDQLVAVSLLLLNGQKAKAVEMASPTDIATAFTDAYAGRYAGGSLVCPQSLVYGMLYFPDRSASCAAADIAGLGSLYGEDSIVSFDGGSVKGRAALVGAMTPRVSFDWHS